MSAPRCDHELLAARAARTGYGSDETRAHIDTCPACAEAAMVASFMNASVRQAAAETPAPPAAPLVYWRARLAARQAALQRAARPVQIVERLAYAAAAVTGAAGLIWAWPTLSVWILRASALTAASSSAAAPGLPILLGVALLPLLLALPVLHTLRSKA